MELEKLEEGKEREGRREGRREERGRTSVAESAFSKNGLQPVTTMHRMHHKSTNIGFLVSFDIQIVTFHKAVTDIRNVKV